MHYVTGVVMQFSTQTSPRLTIRARGKFISKAVDIAEVVRNRFLEGQINVEKVSINSEEFINQDGKKVRVSAIDIVLVRK